MKNIKIEALLILTLAITSISTLSAQNLYDTAIESSLKLESSFGGTNNRSGLAYNPNARLYYSVNAGNTNYPIDTYSANGNRVDSISQRFDYRGLWWNPANNTLEGNGFSGFGIFVQDLDSSTSFPLGTGTTIFSAAQPDVQSCGHFDFHRDEIVYYSNGVVHRFNRSDNSLVRRDTIKNLPVNLSQINSTSIIYTGISNLEYGVYNFAERRLLLINKSNMEYSRYIQLPDNAPSRGSFGMAYANNLFWLFSSPNWNAYQLFEVCDLDKTVSVTETTLTSNEPDAQYQWVDCNNDYEHIDEATSFSFTPGRSGSYAVIITKNSCVDTSTCAEIKVCNIDNSVDIVGTNLSSNQDDANYQWLDCDNNFSPIVRATIKNFTPEVTGRYAVQISLDDCIDTSSCTEVIICTLNKTVSVSNNTLTSDQANARYQWLDCNNKFAPINGEINQSFSPNTNGKYAVKITQQTCVDTSNCIDFTSVGLSAIQNDIFLSAFPNPTNGGLTVALSQRFEVVNVKIINLLGQQVDDHQYQNTESITLSLNFPGIYFIEINADNRKSGLIKVVRY